MKSFDLSYRDMSPASIEQLLLDRGWRHLKTFPGKSSVWRSSANITRWIPLDTSVDDYAEAIDELVDAFAKTEQILPEEAAAHFRQLYL